MNELSDESTTQVAIAPAHAQEPLGAMNRRTWLVTVPLALIVIYAFIPILNNGFVLWDDGQTFLQNPYFRGLGPTQVRWAWTTFLLGLYHPMAWMLFESEHVLWQLDPRGYHFTSLVLQVVDALVLFVLTKALLARCRTDSEVESPWTVSLSAALATALFAVHPLRVEAVAWATGQPYLPCALFSMLSVLAYLRAFPMDSSPRSGWLAGSFFLFVVALLFLPVAVTLPAVLLILDVYPLRRFEDGAGGWFGASARRALLEKVPFVMTSLLFMGFAIAARAKVRLYSQQHYDVSEGIAHACYAIWFYIWKTVIPLNITVVYPLSSERNWLGISYSLSVVATLAISAGLFLSHRRWPGLLAAWLSYLVILAPNSGLIRMSDQIGADRYSYMAMLGAVIVAAAGFCRLWRMSSRWHPSAPVGIVAIGLGALVGLTDLTRNQCRTWLNSEVLWAHALSHGGNASFVAHNNLGEALRAKGSYQAAADHFTEALRLYPDYVLAHNNLAKVLYIQGNYEAAEAHFIESLRLKPGQFGAHYNLGNIFYGRGMHEAAAAQFTKALRLNPGFARAYNNLGIVLLSVGNYGAAMAHFAEAVRLNPAEPDAYNASAMLMAACPDAKFRDGKRAVQFATRACELTKWKDTRFLGTLAAAQAEAGDFDAAIKSQKTAIELVTDQRQKDDYRSRLVLPGQKALSSGIPTTLAD